MIFLGREIHEQRDYSEKVAEQIDIEISNFIDMAALKAKNSKNQTRSFWKRLWPNSWLKKP